MDRIDVGAGIQNPTHHISLSDGKLTIGIITCDEQGNANPQAVTRGAPERTAMKTATGNTTYSDQEPPWFSAAQDDFSGGRGIKDYDKNVNRYADGFRCDTSRAEINLAPLETYATGYRSQTFSMPGSVKWQPLTAGSRKYLAVKFQPAEDYSAVSIYMKIKRVGTPTADLTVELCADESSEPGDVLKTATVSTTTISDIVSVLHKFTITAEALTAATFYWLKVYSSAGNDRNHWCIGYKDEAGTTMQSSDNSTWSASSIDLYYRVTDAENSDLENVIFFRYKYAQYMIQNFASSAPKLYINGYRGVAKDNAADLTLLNDNGNPGWTVNEWANCIAWVTRGPGNAEYQPWRKIVSNTDKVLTLDESWKITHTNVTEYVILGSNKWTEVTGHGLTGKVTDVLVASGFVYFAQGDAINIRRMEWYDNAGTATYRYADDGTNKAEFLTTVMDSTNGQEVWRAQNSDATGIQSVSKATPATSWANLTFAAVIAIPREYGKITNLDEYGETSIRKPWVQMEGNVFRITSSKPDPLPLEEIQVLMAHTNGRATMKHNVYYYWNLGASLERYYDSNLDDIGVNRDEGLPSNRQGVVSALLGHAGKFYMAVNAGTSGYSTVYCNNGANAGISYCEIYRAPVSGQQIYAMAYQVIPGSTLDRMWIAVGNDIVWIPFPSNTLNPNNDSTMEYTDEATLESGWIYNTMFETYKIWYSIKLVTEKLAENAQEVEMDYKIDDDDDWTTVEGVFDTSPSKELKLTYLFTSMPAGKRFKYRLRIKSTDKNITPRIFSVVIESAYRVPVKYSYTFNYRLVDNDFNLLGDTKETLTAEDKQKIIDDWANAITPLRMRTLDPITDDKLIFIDPVPLNRKNASQLSDRAYILKVNAMGIE